ncbi:MAG: polysaccharide biosynthesis C-terminal domain-containing protein [Syntrophorhabdus sp.]
MSTGVFQPAVSHLNAKGHNHRVRKVLINGTKYSMMAVLPIAVAYFIVGDSFIALWVGQKYASAGHTVLIILTIAVIANVSQYTSTQILQGIARHGSIAYITIAEAAANLCLSIFLVRKFGINGAAIGTLIPMLLSNLVFIPWYTCREVDLSLSRFFKEGLLIPCIPAVIFGLILFAVSRVLGVDTWIRFILVITACTASYSYFAWYICLTKPERLERWRDLTNAIGSGLVFARSVILSVRSRVEKTIP